MTPYGLVRLSNLFTDNFCPIFSEKQEPIRNRGSFNDIFLVDFWGDTGVLNI
jgi:hypothetical protein